MSKYTRYLIVADESVKKGKNFSFFFGGCILKEDEYEKINTLLNLYKISLGLHEMKRIKITPHNANDYIKVLDLFFTFVKSGQIRVRVFYAPNSQLYNTRHSQDDLYCKFYYTFIKKAFSISSSNENMVLRLILDELPEAPTSRDHLKSSIIKYFSNLSKRNKTKVVIYKNRIQEADSKEHAILQCVDVITGVIEFYLNNPEIDSNKGKAKLKIFNHIYNNYIKYFVINI